MSEQIIDEVLNLTQEVLDIAAAKKHTHDDYVEKNNNDYYTTEYCNTNFITKTAVETEYAKKNNFQYIDFNEIIENVQEEVSENIQENYTPQEDELTGRIITEEENPENVYKIIKSSSLIEYLNNKFENYLTEDEFDNEVYEKVFDNFFDGKTFNTPINTDKKLKDIIDDSVEDFVLEPGFYKLIGEDSLVVNISEPTDICCKNGILEVKKIGNQRIYHLYATSKKNGEYLLNGKEFIKYDFEEEWRVYKIPKTKINILDPSTKAINVINNSLSVYEITTGYIFTWKNGNNSTYTLTANTNDWESLYNFKKNLPIVGNHIFSNLIGHCDIKIDQNKISIRSIDKPGEVIQGVDVSFFVPRIN